MGTNVKGCLALKGQGLGTGKYHAWGVCQDPRAGTRMVLSRLVRLFWLLCLSKGLACSRGIMSAHEYPHLAR
jgi:hypothetical protein